MVKTRPYESGDGGAIAELAAAYPFNDLRRYRLFNRARQLAYLQHRIDACVQDGSVWVAEAEGRIVAVAAVRPLPWDSSVFTVPMAQIPVFVHDAGAGSREVVAALSELLIAECRASGLRHLNVRIDADDLVLLQELEARRFYLVDTVVTYTFVPRRQELGHVKHLFTTRTYRPEDRGQIIEVAKIAYQNYIGRYHADRHLPRDLSDRLYALWAEQLVDGGLAEQIIVAERKGRIVGFVGYRMKKDILAATGLKVVGGGLGGCKPEGVGAYSALLEEAMREGMHRYDMQDFETQINNVNVVRIYQKLNFEYARAKYTLHAWLD
jgi:hypothetical protein